jgi:hypothetical protein
MDKFFLNFEEEKMGRVKELLMGEEQKRSIAEAIAVDAGALRECEFHSDIFIDIDSDEAKKLAYIIGNKRFTEKSITAFKNRKELTDTIKSVIEEAHAECPDCRKIREE